MRLALTGRHVEITPALQRLAERKVAKLDRLLNDGIVSAQVVLTLEKHRHVVDVRAHARGDHVMHGLGATDAWETSFTEAIEKIEQQLHRVKGKWQQRKRRATPAKALVPALPPPPDGDEEPRRVRIMRASRYTVKPMTVDEAAMEVDQQQDSFLVFRNANTDAVNVLYRRKDGNLGLIEPES
ncbi:MAG: ribosome hibernation-promoting factor, HPF/YfiA family [Bacteroidales bacterium]